MRELLSNEARRAFLPHWHSLMEAGTARGEFQRVHRDGRTIHLEFRAVANFLPGLHVVSLRDVTERQRAEQRLLQSERLAAIGETFTGLAHESRNALQRSRACLELLSLEVEQQPDAVDLVERVLHAQDRLEELYEEVQNYAAPINLESRALDIREVWRSAWKDSIDTSSNREVVFIEECERADFQCDADSDRVRQVFFNIFRNAQEASPPDGYVRLRCSDGLVGNQAAICISIADNGPGMSLEQRERIFDPFYTTKMQGTGLGMAISKRIIQSHGGRICVAEKDGPGTEVVLLLPLLKAPDPDGILPIYQ